MLLAKKERFDYYDLPQVTSKERPQPNRGRRIKNSTMAGYCAITIVTLILAFLLTARHAQLDSVGYELIALQKQEEQLALENQTLQGQIEQLKSLDNIEYIATVKLGMKKPENAEGVQFVPVEYSKAGPKNTVGTASVGETAKNSKPQKKRNFLVQALAGIING